MASNKLPSDTFNAITKSSWHAPLIDNIQNGQFSIDGKISNNEKDITITKVGHNQWLLIDLGRSYEVQAVKLLARRDCCLARFVGHEVRVGDDDPRSVGDVDDMFSSNVICGQRTTNASESTWHMLLCGDDNGGLVGRFVSVQQEGVESVIEMNEVEVYGVEPGNYDSAEFIEQNY
jgi:hypothetical protein